MRKCKEAIETRSPRERILSVLGGVWLALSPEIAAAESSTIRLGACDLVGGGYLEQTNDRVGFRTIRHLVDTFREELLNGCETLEIGNEAMDLIDFVNGAHCEEHQNFPLNFPEELNDPGCSVSLEPALLTNLEDEFTPLFRIDREFEVGEILEMTRNGGEAVTFTVRQIFSEFLMLEPTAGFACIGDSGTPISVRYGNQSVGELSSIYGPNKFVVDGQNCVGVNPGERTGVIVNRPSLSAL